MQKRKSDSSKKKKKGNLLNIFSSSFCMEAIARKVGGRRFAYKKQSIVKALEALKSSSCWSLHLICTELGSW